MMGTCLPETCRGKSFPLCIPDFHSQSVTNTKCRIGKLISPNDGHIIAPKHVEKRNKHTKNTCPPIWFYLQDCTGLHFKQNLKFHSIQFYCRQQIPSTNFKGHISGKSHEIVSRSDFNLLAPEFYI
jgi:hypothetical protein